MFNVITLQRIRLADPIARHSRVGIPVLTAVLWSMAATAYGDGDVLVRINADQTHQVSIVPAEECAFREQKSAVGQIAFNEDASTIVLSPFSGRVTRVIARVGQDVLRGDPLFEIDSPEVVQAQTDLIAAVQTAEKSRSQLSLARRVLERQEALHAEKAAAQREVDMARNELAAAESDYATALGNLTAARNRLRVILGRGREEVERVERDRVVNPLITINAPIDGTVITRKVGPGQYVRPDTAEPLYGIADMSTMWLKAYVPESDIPYVRVDQEVEVKVTALPDRQFKARIIAIGAASDQATRRIVVRSEVANPDKVLKAEMFSTFKIVVAEPETAPVVPIEAVIRDGEQAAVWVQQEERLFQRRVVKLGIEQGGRVQIRDGLRPGDLVVGRGAIFVDNQSKQ